MIRSPRIIKPKKRLTQTVITDYYKTKKDNLDIDKENKEDNRVRGYNSETGSWHCIECGVDMGEMNPRQYCGKWICYGY
jgi:hypothetical protein